MTQLPEKTELGLRPRLIAAGWFGVAASFPVAFFLMLFGRWLVNSTTRFAELWMFGVLPIVTAAFFGFASGSGLLDRSRVTSGLRAAARGLVLAFSSYTLFIVMLLVASSLAHIPGEDTGQSFNPFAIIALFFYGLLYVGWIIAIASAVAGWLFFRISRNEAISGWLSQTSKTNRQVVRKWNAVGIAVLLVSLLPPFVSLRAAHNAELKERMNTDLIAAASKGDTSGVQNLLLKGADVEAHDNANGTPILWAARGGYTEVVRLLLERGANPNVVEHGNQDMTPLLWAASLNDLECVRILLDRGADVNASTTQGYTALMEAAIYGSSDVVRILLDHGANLTLRNNENQTVLTVTRSNRSKPGRGDVEPGQSWTDFVVIERARKRHDGIIHLLESAGAQE